MSLPAATKQTTEKPAPGAVIEPINKDDQAADIDRKIRLYGVIQAFRDGRLPDNAQIDHTLQYVLNHSPVEQEKLSPEGRKLVQDVKDIIETARLIVKEKNSDELFQNFIWHTRDVDADKLKRDPKDVLPENQPDTATDREQAVHHLRTLLNLVLTNSEARKLLSDFGVIGRDLLARGAINVAERVRPDEERLAKVDHTVPQDQFITEGGRQTGPGEKPVVDAKLPFDTHIKHDPDAPQPTVERRGEVRGVGDVVDSGRQQLSEVRGIADSHISDAKDIATDPSASTEQKKRSFFDRAYGTKEAVKQSADERIPEDIPDESSSSETKGRGFLGRLRGIKGGVSERIPQEHKDRVGDEFDRAKNFLSDEYFPPERRDQFIYRGKKVIIECQKHDDYQASLKWLLDTLETYSAHGKAAAKNAHAESKGVAQDSALKQATRELRTLLERFANGRSMDQIKDAVDVLYDDANRDEELRNWFKQVNQYARKVLLQPGFVLEPQCDTEGREIRENGRRFYDDKYKDHFDNLFRTVGDWFKQMGEDPLNARFGEDWARLTKDLLFDSEGSLKFKPHLWDDIRKVILPTVISQVGYIPIPRIEYTDDALDLVIENITLSGKNLLPNIITMSARNYFKFSPYSVINDHAEHEVELSFNQIQADIRDVAFYYRKKTGLPKLSDSGLVDFVLGGEGVNVTVKLVSSSKDHTSVFKVKSVHAKVASLKFSVRDSKHDFLYKTLKPLVTGLVKKQIRKAIEDGVRTGLEYVDGQLIAVRDRMAEAKSEEGKVGESMTKMQILQEMFQRKKEEASSTTSTKARESHFKVVAKRDSLLLPETGHPAGWVSRAAEREDLAHQGEGWKSEAFNIVS
jgi:hypothetical protein